MTLTGKQRRYLRGLAHHLDPVVRVGKDGVTEGLGGALDRALEDHELIKIKLEENAEGGTREEIADALADAGKAELVQILGRTIVLYRAPKPDKKKEAKIRLPRASER